MLGERPCRFLAVTCSAPPPPPPRLSARAARAPDTPTIRIGVLNDQSGPYRDTGGITSVICAKQAVEEFGTSHGFNVEVVTADHQNKPDSAPASRGSGSTATAST